jgi:hypothetical protein
MKDAAKNTACKTGVPGNMRRKVAAVAVAVFLFAFLSVVLTLPDYGLGWDEGNDIARAAQAADWFHLFAHNPGHEHAFSEDTIIKYWGTDTKRPAFTRTYYAMIHVVVSPLSESRVFRNIYGYRVGSALLFGALAAMVFMAGASVSGMAAGFVAAAACIGMPRLFGIAHLQCSDLLLAALYFFAAFAFAGGLDSWRKAVLFGVLAGLLPAVKLTGAVAFVPFFAWGITWRGRDVWKNLLALLFVAPLVFFSAQPGAWHHPLGYPIRYLAEHAHVDTVDKILVPYFGALYAARPPWHYAPVMALLTVPLPVLIAAVTGGAYAMLRARSKPFLSFILVNAVFFIALFCSPRMPAYDGVRLFLPAFPFIALLAGVGFGWAFGWAAARTRAFAALALVLLCLAPAARIHPYEMSYYNPLIGGLPGAARHGMEVTYWGEVISPRVIERLNRILPRGAVIAVAAANPYNFDRYSEWKMIRGDIRVVHYGEEIQYLLLVTRRGSFDPLCGYIFRYWRPEFSLKYDGVPLLSLYHVKSR